jgi:hypothetical protein
MRLNSVASLVLALSLPLPLPQAHANDTVASIVGGNVIFEKTEDISMDSEELEISQDNVFVEYQFRNIKNKPIDRTVSFPLAKMHSETPYEVRVGDWFKGKDPLAFHLMENGKTKPVKIVTTKENQDSEDEIFYTNVNYTWNQHFPAGKTIRISHRYKTILGSGGGTEFTQDEKNRYCMDQSFLKGFESLKSKLKKTLPADEMSLEKGGLNAHLHFNSFGHFSYILKTANNWAGPIGKFRLKIRKNRPSTLVSLCWDGLKKVSDTEFVSEKENFRPTSDLYILFVNEK